MYFAFAQKNAETVCSLWRHINPVQLALKLLLSADGGLLTLMIKHAQSTHNKCTKLNGISCAT